jgi:hypothetical protein
VTQGRIKKQALALAEFNQQGQLAAIVPGGLKRCKTDKSLGDRRLSGSARGVA